MKRPGAVSTVLWVAWCFVTVATLDRHEVYAKHRNDSSGRRGARQLEMRESDQDHHWRPRRDDIPTKTGLPTLLITPSPKTTKLINRQPDNGLKDGLNGLKAKSSSISSSVSTSVSISVSSIASASASTALSAASLSFSSAFSTAVQSARETGLSDGSFSASVSASEAIASANDKAAAASSQLSSALAGVTSASIIASVQASASSAVEAAQSSASSSAQSAIDAAKASASAAAGNTDTPTENSGLSPGEVGGIVVSVTIVSSLLSVFLTLFIIRHRRRKAEAAAHDDSDSRPESSRRLAQPPFKVLRDGFRSPTYTATVTAGSKHPGTQFPPDVKQRIPPPVEHHPAMASSALPASTATAANAAVRSPDEPDFPVSPLTSLRPNSFGREGPPGFGLGFYPGEAQVQTGVPDTGEPSPMKFSLARTESISGGQRVQIVRVGSQKDSLHRVLLDEQTQRLSPPYINPGPAQDAADAYTGEYAEAQGQQNFYDPTSNLDRTISTRTASSAALPTPRRASMPSSIIMRRPLEMNPVQLQPGRHNDNRSPVPDRETSFSSTDDDETQSR
ncbi:Uu.00g073820.m01.CDS01 [Anthostomella pinea]|uniref:Uu.00g073820.m01.CDS01 n=1 Tax=Anthostomella pinea TaxID=933095 RepID=A0AAI8VVB4_9PEZI|nr:Uu.00g073820.m01.CDS01 [Anthostomella pinea]